MSALPKPFPTFAALVFSTYRAIWCVCFALSLWIGLYSGFRAELRMQAHMEAYFAVGIDSYAYSSATGMEVGPYGPLARRVGIRDGDLLLAVDGRTVPSNLDGQTKVSFGPEGQNVGLLLRHEDGSEQLVHMRRTARYQKETYAGSGITFPLRRWIVFSITRFALFATLAAAALLFVRRPQDPIASLLSFSLVLSFVSIPTLIASAPAYWDDAITAIASAMQIAVILFFPSGKLRTGFHKLALVGWLSNTALTGLQHWYPSAFFWMPLGQIASYLLVILALFIGYRDTPPGISRQQLKFVIAGFVGMVAMCTVGALLDLIWIALTSEVLRAWNALISYSVWDLGSLLMPLGLLVSLLRYRLYDADTLISRSAAFAVLTLALVVIFASSEKLIELGGQNILGARIGGVAGGVAAAIAAAMIAPLHERMTRWAEKRFQSGLVHLREGLPLLMGDMRETATPQSLADAILLRTERGVHARCGAILIGDDNDVIFVREVEEGVVRSWLATASPPIDNHIDRADPLFPMRVPLHADGVGLIGWMLLGPRPDGSFYGKDECKTLFEIAGPIARALAISVERSRREESRDMEARVQRQLVHRLYSYLGLKEEESYEAKQQDDPRQFPFQAGRERAS